MNVFFTVETSYNANRKIKKQARVDSLLRVRVLFYYLGCANYFAGFYLFVCVKMG